MDRILILLSNKNNQRLLEKELGKRYVVIIPQKDIKDLEFDLIIIDGVELKKRQDHIRELKNRNFPLFLPVILITTKEDISLAEKFLYETIDELVRIPIEKLELRARIDILLRARFYTYMLAQETIIDPLTEAYNKKYFYETGQKELEHFRRYGRKFSIVFIDIDDFKKINDTYGHLTGDIVLKNLANKLKNSIRKGDLVCRFGGEEFILLLQGSNLENTLAIAERIRQDIAKEAIKTYDEKTISITISAGIATVTDTIKDLQEMIDKANMAMYKAKQSGKNKICL